MPSFSQMRSAFFSHPRKSAGIVWAVSTFIYLIPTCVELTPLGNNDRNSKKDRDDAANSYDETSHEFDAINEKIREARQRVVDLDCAMAGYHGFNYGVVAFQQSINNSNATPIDRLQTFWQLHFSADSTDSEQSVTGKSWDQLDWQWDYYYGCTFDCGKDSRGNSISCCYGSGYHYVTNNYYYNEITTIVNKYKNIIQGSSFHLPSLDCGYYSRQFKTLAPVTYETYESPHIDTGDRRAGSTYVNFYREYGSSVTAVYKLDDTTINFPAIISRPADQGVAAADLATRLYQFLATAIAAFNMAGANYPVLQDTIRKQIPGLLNQAAAINNTLVQKAEVLAGKQVVFDDADHEFKGGLSLWLPMFFLIPGGLALLAYIIASRCENWFEAVDVAQHHVEAPRQSQISSQLYVQPVASQEVQPQEIQFQDNVDPTPVIVEIQPQTRFTTPPPRYSSFAYSSQNTAQTQQPEMTEGQPQPPEYEEPVYTVPGYTN